MKILHLCCFVLGFVISTKAQVVFGSDASGNLEFKGTLSMAGKNSKDVASCLSKSPFLQGVDSARSEGDSSIVYGSYSYGYYVNNTELYVGEVGFQFCLKLNNDSLSYRYFAFEHDGFETSFSSLGILPKDWNLGVGEIFNQKQYGEILWDIRFNLAHSIKMISNQCLR